jgi:multidrug efflux pump subunit AcrA (membrane-fusion protein)
MTVEATTEAYPGERFTGRLEFISAEASPQTGTVRAAAEIANPRKLPLGGLMARVTIVLPAGGEDVKTER